MKFSVSFLWWCHSSHFYNFTLSRDWLSNSLSWHSMSFSIYIRLNSLPHFSHLFFQNMLHTFGWARVPHCSLSSRQNFGSCCSLHLECPSCICCKALLKCHLLQECSPNPTVGNNLHSFVKLKHTVSYIETCTVFYSSFLMLMKPQTYCQMYNQY